ncbi:MAG: hypothetical protein IR526_00215 [Bordetella sp.]|nr:MAG: hypothetical protein IR526_00215 [Bordetella sp.]
MIEVGNKLGLEMEMVIVHKGTIKSHPIQNYFQNLAKIKRSRGISITIKQVNGINIELNTFLGKSGLDNGFNLLETSFSPIQGEGNLVRLYELINQELNDVINGLELENATILNASNHPYCRVDAEWYSRVCTPRRIYKELVGYRKWNHWVGIDSKAQNGPCTSIDIKQAARALNVILGLSPAFIALYANSPIENGEITGLKENRLTMWSKMFRNSRFSGDFFLHCLPNRPFNNLGDYFRWMFGPNTVTRSLSKDLIIDDYKSSENTFLDNHPSLIAFLYSNKWKGYCYETNKNIILKPNVEHFVYSQFAHFLDARWRYSLERLPSISVLLKNWENPKGIEELFEDYGVDGYIEGRATGAVFSDAQLINEIGKDLASTVVISPSALQLGLLRNIEESERLMYRWGWLKLKHMRFQAIKQAFEDKSICKLVKDVLFVAGKGLERYEQHWLDYPRFNFESRKTGADRLLEIWNSSNGDPSERLIQLNDIRTLKLSNI